LSELEKAKPTEEFNILENGHLLRDRYRIVKFLEVKRGANLYRATDEVTNHIVILKEKTTSQYVRRTHSLNLGDGTDKLLKDNPWYDEFVILRSVSYPTVVKAVDCFSEDDKHYLVIEQLEGTDLKYFLTKNKVTLQQSCDWMIQLCQSLSQLHRRNIVHLDLQSRYVVVTRDLLRVRLTGFDSALQYPVKNNSSELSVYSAPEVRNKMPVDNRTDIYSLGVIWHELLTEHKPTLEEVDDSLFEYPQIVEFYPSINPKVNQIISKMLKKNPSERFQSIDELKFAILELFTSITLKIGYCTDVGMEREGNEDSFFVQSKHYTSQNTQLNYGIFIVADGMGGTKAGEYASALATKEISNYINYYFDDIGGKNLKEVDLNNIMEQAVKRANSIIYRESKENKDYSGMGTTSTALLIYERDFYIAHVGDSRAYLINKAGIEKITRDHSLVGRLLEIGQITPEEAAIHPQRNLIYRSLGSFPTVEVDIYHLPVGYNDYILLCSDGLYEYVKDDEIQKIVLSSAEPSQAARHLINLANIRGGDDNTTIVIVKIEEIM